jgi:hypothetical protein
MSAETKDRLFEAVHTRYQKRYGAPILAHTDDEIFALCEKVFDGAEKDEAGKLASPDRVFKSVLTAIWMSPHETTQRHKARWPADKVPGADQRLTDAEAALLEQLQRRPRALNKRESE